MFTTSIASCCCYYSQSYACSLSAEKCSASKKIQSVILQECLYELGILVASATFSTGLAAFFILHPVLCIHQVFSPRMRNCPSSLPLSTTNVVVLGVCVPKTVCPIVKERWEFVSSMYKVCFSLTKFGALAQDAFMNSVQIVKQNV